MTALTDAEQVGQAAATFSANRVVDANRAARSVGVVSGLRRRESQRRLPDLIIHQRDPAAEGRTFEVVLRALDDITPRVEVEEPGWASFASRGPSRYFGGDEAMSERVLAVVQAALVELVAGPQVSGVQAAEPASGHAVSLGSLVGVGTADTRFAALQAARAAVGSAPVVVAPGASRAYLSGLPIEVIGQPDLSEVLRRLGLTTLGAFGGLSARDVLARFGEVGARLHACSLGEERRAANLTDPPADFSSRIELDPPVDRVDQAAFVARTLALEFCQQLGARGLSCAQVAIVAETEHGEELVRRWRGDGALHAGAIADRTRWQLDGWLNGPVRLRPSAGIARLELRPEQVIAADGVQLGFWGERTEHAERAARAVARMQGLLGTGQVSVLEADGGRSPDQQVLRVPAEAVDLVERARGSADARVERDRDHEGSVGFVAQLPPPAPAMVFVERSFIEVVDEEGVAVSVAGRGLLSAAPARISVSGRWLTVMAWAGPWLLDERWWDTERRRRRARLQVVCDDGRAFLVSCEGQHWFVEAVYA